MLVPIRERSAKFPREVREQLKAEFPSMGIGYHKLFKGLPIQGAEYIEIIRRPFLGQNHPGCQGGR